MKRLLVTIAAILLGFVLVACGQTEGPNGAGENQGGHADQGQGAGGEVGQNEKMREQEQVGEDELAPTDDEEGEEQEVVLYFSDTDLMQNWRVKKTITVKEGENPAQKALQAWVEGPDHEELTSLVPKETVVESVEENGDVVEVSFSKDLLNANVGSAGEMLIMEQIAMILEQFGYSQVQILVEGEKVETLFGHMTADEPIEVGNPEDFPWKE